VTTDALPPTLAANPRLGDWVRISSDGIVEIRSGKVELGQGVLTALAQVAAEELDVDVARIEMTATTTDLSPDEGLTAGSLSIQHSGAALRQVCAEVRDMFIGIAADKLAVPREELTIEDGQFSAPDGAATSYWELADDTLLDRTASGDAAPKPVADYRVVGTSVARLDLPDKLGGRPRYVHDLTLDGMVHGRVVRPPSRGATLRDIDTGPTEDLPGVIAVVRDGSFLAVVAEHEETALRAADLLRRDAVWEQRPTLPDEDALPAFLTSAPTDTTGDRGCWDNGHRASASPLTHSSPTIARTARTASIGPSCAVALARTTASRSGRTARECTCCAVRRGRCGEGFRRRPSRGPARRRRWLPRPQRRRTTRRWTPQCSPWPYRADRQVVWSRPDELSWSPPDPLGWCGSRRGLRPRRQRVVVAPRDLGVGASSAAPA
jgi:hypothetical protein